MRMHHYFTYGYCYYYDVWAGVGFQENQPPKLVIRLQNLSASITTQSLCRCRHSPLFHQGGGGITHHLSLKLGVMGGLFYDTLPKVCDDDQWVPAGEAWSMESTLPLKSSNQNQVMQLTLQGSPTEEGQDVEVSCELDKRRQVHKSSIEVMKSNLINYICMLKHG